MYFAVVFHGELTRLCSLYSLFLGGVAPCLVKSSISNEDYCKICWNGTAFTYNVRGRRLSSVTLLVSDPTSSPLVPKLLTKLTKSPI
jgi:hypothetical protein